MELVPWDKEASAVFLGSRVHPDVEDARVRKQGSPTTLALMGPLRSEHQSPCASQHAFF